MTCSTGITVSGVVVIIGSMFTLLCGTLILLGSIFTFNSSRSADAPVNLGYILVIEAVVTFAFGGWGLASGIGLLKTKQWARISTLVYAAILVFISLPLTVIMAIIPLPNTPGANDPNPPLNIMLVVRVGMSLVYAMFAALGGYWLYFFNTQKMKAQFRGQQPFTESAQSELAGLPSANSAVRFGPDQYSRPLSITIIEWYLIIGSALGPLSILFTSTLFPRSKLPVLSWVFVLEKCGCEVTVAENGQAAVNACATQRFDLILMDIQMPGMDGLEATAAIRKKEIATAAHMPIIAMTAHALKGDKERCLAAGMDGYVSKPIRTIELFAAIEDAMQSRSAPTPVAPPSDQHTDLDQPVPNESLNTKI